MLFHDDLTVEERENQPLIEQLQQMYDTRIQDEQDLLSIRQQLLRSDRLPTASPTQKTPSHLDTSDKHQGVPFHAFDFSSRHKTPWSRPLNILAAMLIVTLLTGSLVAVLGLARSHRQPNTATRFPPTPRPSMTSVDSSQASVDAINMVDQSVGWSSMTISNGNYKHIIARTTDGGLHWIDVTPANLTVSTGDLYNLPFLHVLNASTAWIGNGQTSDASHQLSPNPSEVFFTLNGGQTWRKSTFPGAGKFLAFSFINTHDGWGISSQVVKPQQQGLSSLEIFRTQDGGQTWVKIAAIRTHVPPFDYGEINFINPTTGWLLTQFTVVSTQGNKNIISTYSNVHVTRDGGKMWQPENLSASGRLILMTGMPHFFNDHEGVVINNEGSGPSRKNVFFITHDSGQTWTSIPPSSASDGSSASGGLSASFFLNATHWWVINYSNPSIYATRDGGQHWITYSEKDFQQFQNLDFVSDKIGWALAAPTEHSANAQYHLFKTIDGGITWTPIKYNAKIK